MKEDIAKLEALVDQRSRDVNPLEFAALLGSLGMKLEKDETTIDDAAWLSMSQDLRKLALQGMLAVIAMTLGERKGK